MRRVETAAGYEIERQITCITNGEAIRRETRGFDVASGSTFHLRFKESSVDYRFFADPDLPPLVVSDDELARVEAEMPEDKSTSLHRLQDLYGLSGYQISVLQSQQVLRLFDDAMSLSVESDKKALANVVFNTLSVELAGMSKYLSIPLHNFPVTPSQLIDAVAMTRAAAITVQQEKMLFRKLFEDESSRNKSVKQIVDEMGWKAIQDTSAIRDICKKVILDEKNEKSLLKYKNGNVNMINFFFGCVMKACKGQADPATVKPILEEILSDVVATKS
jgi:aspartyl-tRNA(Asn)/glutamyl-tRNA(Gln) amidotransferase subunit B